jgi:sugar phosphate isomerase/epimerase
VAVLAFALCLCCLPRTAKADSWKDWKLGMQAYSFNRFTFYEAVDKTRALGMRYIEVYPGQKLSAQKPDVKTDHNMSSQDKKLMLAKLADAGVTLTNYGVVGLPNNEAECRKVFAFAKEMGIETIVSEPPEDKRRAAQPSATFSLLGPRHGLETLQRPEQVDRRVRRHGPLDAFQYRPTGGHQEARSGQAHHQPAL